MKSLAALVAAVSLTSCAQRSSDEQQVRELIASVESAAENRDASDVLEFVADDYDDANGLDRMQLQNFLRGYFLAHPRIELLVNIEQLDFPAEGLARARIAVTNLTLENPDHVRLKVEFRRQGGEWRVRRADRESGS